VDSVIATKDTAYVYLSNRGQMVMPVTLELTYADGTKETRALPIEMWNLGNRFTARVATPKPLVAVTVDPQRIYPDVDRTNNTWRRGR